VIATYSSSLPIKSRTVLGPHVGPHRFRFVLADLFEVHQLLYPHLCDVQVTSQHSCALRPIQQRDLELDSEVLVDVQQIHSCEVGGRPHNQQPAIRVLRDALDENRQSLHNGIVEIRPSTHILHQSLNVVNDDERLFGLVGVSEDLVEAEDAAVAAHSHVLLWAYDLDVGELGLLCEERGDGGFARALGAVQQDGAQLSRPVKGDIGHLVQHRDDILKGLPIIDQRVPHEHLKGGLVEAEPRSHL